MSLIDNHLAEFNSAIEHFKQDLTGLKTGRANPQLLDNIRVEAYGTRTPLNQVASVSVPEPRSIVIQPWDKSIIKEIEKAILESDLKLSPANEGERIRINIPSLTEETRKEIVKLLGHKAEQARIAIRLIRDKVKEEIMAGEKNKDFGEDERYSLIEELDKKTGEFNDQVKDLAAEKETEIMTV